ncbi:MAG: hypothetical protein K2H01_12205 [Ruminococcus sp.]|nr:hypothetical protein [Ruminococcus sp.]
MKQPIITLALLLISAIPCVADQDNSGTTTNPQHIRLRPKEAPDKRQRVPAKPIYGEFANQVLNLYLDEISESSYILTISKDNTTVENATLSSTELVCGYTVSASVPFTVELTTENNVAYVGEVSE